MARALEQTCKENFAIDITVKQIIARDVYAGKDSYATLFEDNQGLLYAFCDGTSLTLADVKEIVHGMGMEADTYFPPYGDPHYFLEQGKKNFFAVFPGRISVKDDEIRFYQTLAVYNPALVRITRVKGEIREFSPLGKRWQPLKNYSYARMRVSSGV